MNNKNAFILDGINEYKELQKITTSLKGLTKLNEEETEQHGAPLAKMWELSRHIVETNNKVGRKFKDSDLISCLEKIANKDRVTIEDIDDFIINLEKAPLKEMYVVRPLYGFFLPSETPLEFGLFSLYNLAFEVAHKKLLSLSYLLSNHPNQPFSSIINKMNFPDENNRIIILYQINAASKLKALEKANKEFLRFENIISFLLNDREFGVNLQQAVDFEFDQVAVFDDSKLYSLADRIGKKIPALASEELTEHKWIWNTIGNQNIPAYHKQILSAIEWIGKANKDVDNSRAFVQYIFALESLFTFSEQGTFANPSVVVFRNKKVALTLTWGIYTYVFN